MIYLISPTRGFEVGGPLPQIRLSGNDHLAVCRTWGIVASMVGE